MHPLKNNSVVKLSFSFNFVIKFAFTSLFSLRAKNWLFFKIIILLVYIPIILNRVFIIIIKKQGISITLCDIKRLLSSKSSTGHIAL